MSEYKDALKSAMDSFAKDQRSRFIGYGVKELGRGGGTFADVPKEKCIETPVAENLMVGIAIGLALKGLRPLVYIERCDFLLNALDAIVNHLDKIETMSKGEFKPAVLFRIVVGNSKKPLYTGPTHCQDFSDAFAAMVDFPVWRIRPTLNIGLKYATAHQEMSEGQSCALFEYKDLL